MTRASNIVILTIVAICVFLACDVRAHPAWGIAVDRQGQVYFSDLKTIWRIDTQGKLSVFRADGHTHELNVDEAGNIYGEHDFSAIWKMTPAGSFSYLFAPTDNPPKGISIWRDRDGNMYSVEQNNHLKRETLLLKRTPSGNVSVLAGSSYGHADGKGSQAKFSNIVGIAFGPDGSLYLVDSSSIRKVTMDGAVTTLARNVMVENASGNPAGGSSLFGIAVDAQGNAFVADYGNRRVLKVTPDGRIFTLMRAEQPWSPTGVALRNGNIYVLEHGFTPPRTVNGARVRRLSSDGSVTVLATVGGDNDPAGRGNLVGENTAPTIESKQNAPYALTGIIAAIGVFALTIIVWLLRRRTFIHQH